MLMRHRIKCNKLNDPEIVNSMKTKGEPEEGGGSRTPSPPEKLQKIGFLSNTGPDPLKNH